MVAFVKANKKKVSKQLKEMIDYTLKAYKEDEKSVTAQDFRSLVSDIKAELSDPTPQASAASVKKEKSEKTKKKSSKKEKIEKKAEKEEKPKKKAKKKKSESGVTPLNTKGEAFDIAEVFKDEFETPLGVITKDDSIKSIKDIAKILEGGEKEVLCAVYWTERHLKQFPYAGGVVPQPKSFENDLDLVSIIFVAPDNSLMIGVSSYTFAPVTFIKDDMKQTDGIRYSAGAEFNVYTLEGEAE